MPLRSLNFLIVDDHKLSRTIVVEALRAVGATKIRQAECGSVAIEMVAEAVPDIAIVDVRMPYDGLSLLKHIRSPESPDRKLPVVMLTAHTERRRIEELRDAGATEIVTKPMSVQALFKRVAAVIENPRPFITTSSYVGPCRRRTAKLGYTGPRRRRGEQDEVELE